VVDLVRVLALGLEWRLLLAKRRARLFVRAKEVLTDVDTRRLIRISLSILHANTLRRVKYLVLHRRIPPTGLVHLVID
jgi:hypothetical protein